MSIKIKNLTNRFVLLRLNSGVSLHIAPRITSEDILDVELENNAKVEKLKMRHVIALHEVNKKKATESKKEKAGK